jgi:flagellar biosynthesis/type III secretory pathway M-ring protein FliF/YscJ
MDVGRVILFLSLFLGLVGIIIVVVARVRKANENKQIQEKIQREERENEAKGSYLDAQHMENVRRHEFNFSSPERQRDMLFEELQTLKKKLDDDY